MQGNAELSACRVVQLLLRSLLTHLCEIKCTQKISSFTFKDNRRKNEDVLGFLMFACLVWGGGEVGGGVGGTVRKIICDLPVGVGGTPLIGLNRYV